MDKQTYLKRFSRAARWRLGHREAEEVVADYAELLEQRPPEQDDTLIQDLGKPEAAARLLTEEKAYRRWLWSFWVMTACLLLPELILTGPYLSGQPRPIEYGVFFLGVTLALVWFHSGGEKTKRPRALLWILVAMTVMLVAAAVVLACLFTGAWETWPPEWYGLTAFFVLSLASTVAVAAGIFGTIRARTDDRRWAALYILGLTTAVISLQIMTALVGLCTTDTHWLQREGIRWAVLGGIGLVGTGVVLC